jgi:hypothetical protein
VVGKDAVVTADLHGEAQLALMGVVWQGGSDVVQRRQANVRGGKQELVVLSVRVGPNDQPVPCKRVEEAPNRVVCGTRRHNVAHQSRDIGRPWTTPILVLALWVHAEDLANILLMDPNQLSLDVASVVAIDDYGALVLELPDAGACHHETGAPCRVKTEVLV